MPKRIDTNQPGIVALYRKLGCHVAITSAVGKGFPDIVVSTHGVTCLVEIKDGSKNPSRQKLTPLEKQFHDECNGYVVVIKSEADVIGHVREMRQRGLKYE